MMCTIAIFPFMDALSKTLSGSYAPEQITWAHSVVHVGLILPFVVRCYGFGAVRANINRLQFARGLSFAFMTMCYIADLRWMPLADGMAIVFLFPLIVTAMSGMLLGEQVGIWRWEQSL